MRDVTTPHFDLPFRFGPRDKAEEVQQDTLDDVTNCVEVCIRTHIGRRKEIPLFGIPDLTFRDQPIRMSDVLQNIARAEPRAVILADQHPEVLDELIANIRMQTSLREEPNA